MTVNFDQNEEDYNDDAAIVHVISDSLGDTASGVVGAAAGQFERGSVHIKRLSKVTDIEQVRAYFDENADPNHPTAVFHTIVDSSLRNEVRHELDRRGIPSIDLIGPAISVLSTLTGSEPMNLPGAIHNTDDRYFRRVEAMEYFVEHDDGRNPQDLPTADVVLVGVSRTSKTPLSMYLAFLGFKVANVPLALGVNPPAELADVDPGRVFGLVSTTDTLATIRQSRLSDDAAYAVASSYADPQEISVEQMEARAEMKKLGCIVIHTENKAVEETAAEIIEHVEALDKARSNS
ncbi:MAG: kinase/pyrophosphorylase [Atopobiaceae bacterium]|nr:kinase/pyrophosphorylase [Atopobiaceae bacterium]MCI2173166.1 kinase/pyrophosphorylase [Atopobiaceae bacterium]MCI2208259.1 kinase/pyrophosphorylase [Atopobiaceae bacterium]